MGLFNKLMASSIEASKLAKKYINEAADYTEKRYEKEEWYTNAKEIVKKTKVLVSETSQISREAIKEISNTEVGKHIGNGTRKLGAVVSQIPVVTLPSDIIKSKNGINELYALIKANPYKAEYYIWLAEAMKRVEVDRKVYTGFRTIIHPTSLLVRKTIRSSMSMGLEKTDVFAVRILKNAYYLSVVDLRKNPKSDNNLHVLARVYLLTGHIKQCIKFCKLAIIANPNNKLPFITLARAYLISGQYLNCKKAANIAISNKLNYAYEILAKLLLVEETQNENNKIVLYSSLKDRVCLKDTKIYLGCAINGDNFFENIGKEQVSKFNNIIDKTRKIIN